MKFETICLAISANAILTKPAAKEQYDLSEFNYDAPCQEDPDCGEYYATFAIPQTQHLYQDIYRDVAKFG